MPVASFDHVALPTVDPEALIVFYGALGFRVPDPDEWKASGAPLFAIHFGTQKINVHAPALWQNDDFTLRGPTAKPGCGDLCFVWEGGREALHQTLEAAGAEIIAGPVELDGGGGRGVSVYTRDPDANLLEFIIYD